MNSDCLAVEPSGANSFNSFFSVLLCHYQFTSFPFSVFFLTDFLNLTFIFSSEFNLQAFFVALQAFFFHGILFLLVH
jgi:hypothetical protein